MNSNINPIVILIHEDGIGFTKNVINNGNGLLNTKKRIEVI